MRWAKMRGADYLCLEAKDTETMQPEILSLLTSAECTFKDKADLDGRNRRTRHGRRWVPCIRGTVLGEISMWEQERGAHLVRRFGGDTMKKKSCHLLYQHQSCHLL